VVQLQTIERDRFDELAVSPGEGVIVDSLWFSRDPATVPWFSRARVVALVHHLSSLESGARGDPASHPEAQWLRRAQRVLVTSQFMAQHVHRLAPQAQVRVCRPGLDPWHVEAAARQPHATPVILSVGHIIERKGYLEATRALARLAERRPQPWSWRVIGNPDFEPDYARRWRDAVAEAGVEPRLEFLGPLSPRETAKHYRQADVFLLAPTFEAFGMVFIEALAAGLPVVAFAAGEVQSLVDDAHGRVVPVGDIEGLADGVDRWLGRPRPEPVAERTWDDVANEFAAALPAESRT
jgi:glycosyltransferase involved in cell wall biosynthesis